MGLVPERPESIEKAVTIVKDEVVAVVDLAVTVEAAALPVVVVTVEVHGKPE